MSDLGVLVVAIYAIYVESLEGGVRSVLWLTVIQGKSLSLICGSLTWLRDHKAKAFEEGLDWEQDGRPGI